MSLFLDITPSLDIMVAVGLFTTSTSLIFRLVARYKQRLLFGMDDYLAALAWFVFLGANIAGIYALIQESAFIQEIESFEEYASGQLYVSNQDKAISGGALCNIVALGCSRLSAVFFYRRIFYTVKQDVFDIITKIMIGTLLLWTVCFFLSTLLACGTDINFAMVGYYAANPPPTMTCNIQGNQSGLAISSFLLDFLVLILPLPKIWALYIPRVRKIAISSVFLIALISLAASILRMAVVFEMVGLFDSDDSEGFEISVLTYFYQLLETAACLTAINMPSSWYFSRYLKAERLRQIAGVILSAIKLRGSAEKSNTELLKSESIELSDSEAVPAEEAHLEPESSHAFSQYKNAECQV